MNAYDSSRVAEIHEALVESTVGPYMFQRWQMDQMEREDIEEYGFDEGLRLRTAAVSPSLTSYPAFVNWLTDRMTIPPDDYAELDDQARIYSFSIASNFDVETIRNIQLSLGKAFDKGRTFEEWHGDLDEVLDEAGVAEDDKLTKGRAALVFRNAWQNANAGAKWQEVQQRKGFVGMLQYVTIGDDRVRPAHRAMHLYAAPPDDPIWNRWRPPCGHNCRCTLLTFTSRDVARGRVMASGPAPTHTTDYDGNTVPVEPDDGWGSAPAPLAPTFADYGGMCHG